MYQEFPTIEGYTFMQKLARSFTKDVQVLSNSTISLVFLSKSALITSGTLKSLKQLQFIFQISTKTEPENQLNLRLQLAPSTLKSPLLNK
jgi:hypothetical protein